jgi:hypothetical protein
VIFSILVVLTNQYVHSNSSDQNNQYGAVPDYDQSGATRRRARRCPMFFVLVASLVMMDCAWPESGQPVTGVDAQLEDRFLHGVTGIADQVYATPAGFRPLTLDLYLPAKRSTSPNASGLSPMSQSNTFHIAVKTAGARSELAWPIRAMQVCVLSTPRSISSTAACEARTVTDGCVI